MSNRSNDFIKALHTIKEFCLSINCEDCPLFMEKGLSVCEFKPYLWVAIPSPSDMAIEALKTEAKKCPICGSDLYEHCGMCCYEGEKVRENESCN